MTWKATSPTEAQLSREVSEPAPAGPESALRIKEVLE